MSLNRDCTVLKFMFSKKATKIYEIVTVDLILCSKCQIDGEDFVNFLGLLRKHKLYQNKFSVIKTFDTCVNSKADV